MTSKLLGLILPIFISLNCQTTKSLISSIPNRENNKTRVELGLPTKGEGVFMDHLFDAQEGFYVRHTDTNRDGVSDLEEVYVVNGGNMPYFTLSKNPLLIWYDKNKNRTPEENEMFGSINLNERWAPYVQFRKQMDSISEEELKKIYQLQEFNETSQKVL